MPAIPYGGRKRGMFSLNEHHRFKVSQKHFL